MGPASHRRRLRLRSTLAVLVVTTVSAPAIGWAQIRCGDTLRRTVVAGQVVDTLTFAARAAEVVSIATVGVPDPAHDVPPFVPRWELRGPDVQIVPTSRGKLHCRGECETQPLPGDGTFTVRVFASRRGEGRAYDISLDALSETADGLPNGPPAPACAREIDHQPDGTRVISSGVLLNGTIQAHGETDTFTFSGVHGDVARIAVAGLSVGNLLFNPRWQLFDPRGQRVVTSRRRARCEDLCDTQPLPLDGTYTIEVADRRNNALGDYTLLLGAAALTTTTTTSSTSTTSTSGTSISTSSSSSTAFTTSTSTTSTIAPGDRQPLELGGTLRHPATPEAVGAALAATDDRLVLGAPHDWTGAPDAGAAYVIRVGGTPGTPGFGELIQTLLEPEPGVRSPGDAFGAAVAVVGDGTLVGAPGDDTVAENAGAAYLFPHPGDDAHRVIFPPGAELSAGAAFGSSVAGRGTDLVIGAPGSSPGGVRHAGSVYVVSGSSITPLAKPGTAHSDDEFGFFVAANTDDILVGAPGGGEVYLFERGGNVRGPFTSPAPEPADGFGSACAFTATSVIVGAPGSQGGRGAVFVFDRESRALLHTVQNPSPHVGDRFGAAIALTPQGLLVGAPADAQGATGGGVAYLFDSTGGTLLRVIGKPAPVAGDGFGAAIVAVGGRMLFGAPGDDSGSVDGGAAYLFDGGLLQAVFRKHLLTAAFGNAVTGADDTVVVGAPGDAGGQGLVYALGSSGAPTVLRNPAAVAGSFGHAVAALGAEVLVGAPTQDGPTGAHVGAVHVFDGAAFRRTLLDPNPVPGNQFGFAVAAVGGDVVVGTPFAGGLDTGAVYVLDGASGTLRETLHKVTPTTGDFFGAAVAAEGDQVLVGAPLDSAATPGAGAAYLLHRGTGALDQIFHSPEPATGDLFGAAVALAGSQVVIGAPLAHAGATDPGRAYVFARATGALLLTLDNPTPGRGGQFGAAVAVVGDGILVGAPADDAGALDTGAAHLFDAATGALLETFRNPAAVAFDRFGTAVAAAPSGLLVGAPGTSRVYLFERTGRAAVTASAVPVRPAAPASAVCGNGIVEEGEACDDGNAVDTDDCRSDCRGSYCCAFDPLAPQRCDDRDPCTDDALDPVTGCTHVDNGTCCPSNSTCQGGVCRLCVGCSLYPWECCDRGSVCLQQSPECRGAACFSVASCECSGGLRCDREAVPAAVSEQFTGACDQVRLQESVTPDASGSPRLELQLGRTRAKKARKMLRLAARLSHRLAVRGELTRACGKTLRRKMILVRRSIPRGRRLRRCVLAP